MDYNIKPFRVENYETAMDSLRMIMEFIFVLVTLLYSLVEVKEMLFAVKHTGSFFGYFQSGWNYLDVASLVANLYLAFQWVSIVQRARSFEIQDRYEVYKSLTRTGRMLEIEDGGLDAMMNMFNDVTALSGSMQQYSSLTGLCLILLIVRLLKMLDFQKRMGVVTRTIETAFNDLGHFFILFALVFLAYGALANVSFGPSVLGYSTLPKALHTNFLILLGDVDVCEELFQLPNPIIGVLFFYSYVLFCLFILLNFLLAIIVDAYVEVKAEAAHSLSFPAELAQLVKSLFSSLYCIRGKKYISDKDISLALQTWLTETQTPIVNIAGTRCLNVEGYELSEDQLFAALSLELKKNRHQDAGSELLRGVVQNVVNRFGQGAGGDNPTFVEGDVVSASKAKQVSKQKSTNDIAIRNRSKIEKLHAKVAMGSG